ncbi:MAG: hypothetical protein K8T91_22345 [Planctomycetes bacterium]|nr:hypothetical protein [Planctomycetota bacterium]
MSLHKDLLRQAERLARLDAKKPKQANLRRAVSSVYYALFHFAVDEACRVAIGSQHDQTPFRQILARAFVHGTMSQACTSFAGGTLKASVTKGLSPALVIPSAIKTLATVFVELQEKRHIADYDLSERFRREDVLSLIQQAELATKDFAGLPTSNEKKFFLACLWAWGTLVKR